MKWIKLKDRIPNVNIDGEKILIYRILNKAQEEMEISIFYTKMVKHCNPDETWWMTLPEKPKN